MVNIFCGVQLNLENFVKIFGPFILQNTQDQILQHVVNVILLGKRESRIIRTKEGERSRTEYFYENQLQFKLNQVQTIEILEKFEECRSVFENTFNIQLIIKREKFLYFYVGEEIVLDMSKSISNIQVQPETQNKLKQLLVNHKYYSIATVFAII